MESLVENLEQRITRLEDVESIKRLKATYCYLVDSGLDDSSQMDAFEPLFANDIWVDFDFLGTHKGKAAVLYFYQGIADLLSYSAHQLTNPLIDVTGDRATGQWYVLVPMTFRKTGRAVWLQARYDEEYLKLDGRWLWQSITARFDHISPYEEGWSKTPMIDLSMQS